MTKTTSVNLGDLAPPFEAWCTQRGVSRSFAIRQLVAVIVDGELQPSLPLTASVTSRVDEWLPRGRTVPGPARSFTVKLTAAQREQLTARSAKAGMSCQRYVLAAITACDSDAATIAGKDAVQALNRSNALLAQVMVQGLGRAGAADRVAAGALGSANPVGHLVELLRDHLSRAAKVLSDVELTRAGHALPKRGAGESKRAKPGGPGRGSATMG